MLINYQLNIYYSESPKPDDRWTTRKLTPPSFETASQSAPSLFFSRFSFISRYHQILTLPRRNPQMKLSDFPLTLGRPTGLKVLCSIKVAFDANLWDKLPEERVSGGTSRVLTYDVIMKVTAGSLLWSIEVDDQPYGNHRLEITYE